MKFLVFTFFLSLSTFAYSDQDIYETLDRALADNEARVALAVSTFVKYSSDSLKKLYCPGVASKVKLPDIEQAFSWFPKKESAKFKRLEIVRRQFIYEAFEGEKLGLLAYRIRLYNDNGDFKRGMIQLKAKDGCLYTVAILPVTMFKEFQAGS